MTLAYIFAFPMGFGATGVWWGLATGLAFASVLMIWRYLMRDSIGLVGKHTE